MSLGLLLIEKDGRGIIKLKLLGARIAVLVAGLHEWRECDDQEP